MSAAPRLITLALAASLTGCSSSAYDQALSQRLNAYRREGEFAELNRSATSLAEGWLRIRVPLKLSEQLAATADPQASRPPFVRDFPGFLAAFAARLKGADGVTFPALLTVGVVPVAEQQPADIKAKILEQVKLDGSFTDPQWKTRSVTDLAGTARDWDVLELLGQQVFTTVSNGLEEDKQWDGTCEIWVSSAPDQERCVVLAWRVPAAIDAQVSVARLAPLVATTLQAGP